MSQATTQSTHETPTIDRLLSYINEYRHVMEFLKEKHPEVLKELQREL